MRLFRKDQPVSPPLLLWQENLQLHWFLLGFTDSLQTRFSGSLSSLVKSISSLSFSFFSHWHTTWFKSFSHPSLFCTFCHYLIFFNCRPKIGTTSPPFPFILFLSTTLSSFQPHCPSSFNRHPRSDLPWITSHSSSTPPVPPLLPL